MRSDSVKNMSAYADQNHAPSLTDVRLEFISIYSGGIILLQFSHDIFLFPYSFFGLSGYTIIASKKMTASSLVMFPAISRKAMVQTGTMPLLQSRTIPRYRNPSAASLTERMMVCSFIFFKYLK